MEENHVYFVETHIFLPALEVRTEIFADVLVLWVSCCILVSPSSFQASRTETPYCPFQSW